MNAKTYDKMQRAIQRVLDSACEDPDQWPDFYCPPNIAEKMADAAEVVFDAIVKTAQYQEKELA